MKGLATLLLFIGFLGFVTPIYGLYEKRPTAELEKIRLAIDGMDCLACANKVKTALEKIPGVTDVLIDQPANLGLVTTEEGTDHNLLIQAVRDAGFDAFIPPEEAPKYPEPWYMEEEY